MSDTSTPNPARTAPETDDSSLPTRAWQQIESRVGRGRVGTVALLAGGALLARAIRGRGRSRLVQATAGVGLLGLGVRQRLTREGEFDTGRPGGGGGPGDDGSDDSSGGIDTAERTAHAVEPRSNPRDISEEPDVETETDEDEGSVQFTTAGDGPTAEPHLDEGDEDEEDPRLDDEDGATEVDLSKTAMADEPNEAVGPQAEQAQPATTEGTEPESTPTEDASHMQADEPATDESVGDGDGDEASDDVSTEDSYEGERGEDGTVDENDSEESGAATGQGDEDEETDS